MYVCMYGIIIDCMHLELYKSIIVHTVLSAYVPGMCMYTGRYSNAVWYGVNRNIKKIRATLHIIDK